MYLIKFCYIIRVNVSARNNIDTDRNITLLIYFRNLRKLHIMTWNFDEQLSINQRSDAQADLIITEYHTCQFIFAAEVQEF